MRLFIAIELEEKAKSFINAAANSLSLFGRGSFCPKEGYHITLAFLGEVADTEHIKTIMTKTEFTPFTLKTEALGSFGNTYFVSLSESLPLKALQNQIAAALQAENVWFDSKAFVPHVTIARRFEKQGEPFVFVPEIQFEVREISLMCTVGAGVYKTLYKKSCKM